MPAFTSIALGVAAAGAAVSAVGSIKAGKAQKKMAEQQAEFDLEAAAGRERDYRRETSFILAARRAGLGAQGVRAEGTPTLVDDSIVTESELQALRIRQGGEAQARILRQGGQAAQTAGYFRGGASLLSGIGTVGSMGGWGTSSGMNTGIMAGDVGWA
jgi:hypothetical protein